MLPKSTEHLINYNAQQSYPMHIKEWRFLLCLGCLLAKDLGRKKVSSEGMDK